MTYQNELNTNERNNISDDIRYTHWIIIGVVTLAIVIVIAIFTSTGNYPDHQTTSNDSAFSPSPSTTVFDGAPPIPANR